MKSGWILWTFWTRAGINLENYFLSTFNSWFQHLNFFSRGEFISDIFFGSCQWTNWKLLLNIYSFRSSTFDFFLSWIICFWYFILTITIDKLKTIFWALFIHDFNISFFSLLDKFSPIFSLEHDKWHIENYSILSPYIHDFNIWFFLSWFFFWYCIFTVIIGDTIWFFNLMFKNSNRLLGNYYIFEHF